MKEVPLYEVREIKDLKDMLAQSVSLYGDTNAFLIKKKQGEPYTPVTFKQYNDDVNCFGTALMELDLNELRVALISKSRYEWYITYMAAVNSPGIIIPLDKELPKSEIKSLLLRSHADVVVYSHEHKEDLDSMKDELPDVKYYVDMDADTSSLTVLSFSQMMQRGKELLENGNRSYLDVKIDPEVMKILLFTSGTTSDAKAVMLSHHNICYNLMGMTKMVYIGPGDVFLSVLPLHHTYECTCGFLCQIYRGSTIAQCEGLRYIMKNMQEAKPTIILVVPLMVESFYKKIYAPANIAKLNKGKKISGFLRKLGIDIRRKIFAQVHNNFGGNLRLLISGGAPIDNKIMLGLQDLGLHIIQGYGLTECAPILALNRDIKYNNSSAGLALPGVDVKIVNPDENGIGEIIGKGENVMLGYYENEEATSEAIKDGYFYTGDLGYIDKDGFVIITGRKKNVIVTKNGKNIFPEEIEALLCRSNYVSECLVSGKNDDKGELIVCAEIYPDFEKIKEDFGQDVSEDKIKNIIDEEVKKVNHSLTTYKYVKNVTIRDSEFTKTTSKKIKRNYSK